MSIDTVRLDEIFKDVLLNNDEVNEEGTAAKEGIAVEMVEGIVVKGFGFHKQRLEGHREQIKAMLEQLNPRFEKGASFLEGCDDKDGAQWGEHRNMEQLFCLGIGLGLAKYCMSRNMWSVLPGGMPYILLNLEGFQKEGVVEAT